MDEKYPNEINTESTEKQPKKKGENKIIIVVILFIAIIAIAGYLLFTKYVKRNSTEIQNAQTTPELKPTPTDTESESINKNIDLIDLSEVEKHNSEQDCWLVINNNVYDVTSFVASHPGGKAILEGCGKDATDLFETRPMGSKTPHSAKARSLLENYMIGKIKQ